MRAAVRTFVNTGRRFYGSHANDTVALLKQQIDELRKNTEQTPEPPSNRHFFVGPPMSVDAQTTEKQDAIRKDFEKWVKDTYGYPIGEVNQRSHRNGKTGLPPTLELMATIAKYGEFHESVLIGKTPGGAHIAQTSLIANTFDPNVPTYVDTLPPRRESLIAKPLSPIDMFLALNAGNTNDKTYQELVKFNNMLLAGRTQGERPVLYSLNGTPNTNGGKGHFRNIWAIDIANRFIREGKEANLIFADEEGVIPTASKLIEHGVKQILGVGNETTTATTYSPNNLVNLMEFLLDPSNRATIDLTSHLGAQKLPDGFFEKADTFFSIVKAFAGKQGIGIVTLSQRTQEYIRNNPAHFDVDTGFRLAHIDPNNPNKRTLEKGPFFDQKTGKMGPVINTDDIEAILRSIFELRRMEKSVGPIESLIEKSQANLRTLEEEVAKSDILEFAVKDPSKRSASVALLSIKDTDLTPEEKKRAVVYMRSLNDTEGIKRPNGEVIPGLNMAIDTNEYPGTDGEIRIWIGGVRPNKDIPKAVKIFEHSWQVAKSVVLEERLAQIRPDLFEQKQAIGKNTLNSVTLIAEDQFLYKNPEEVDAAIARKTKELSAKGISFIDARNENVDYTTLNKGNYVVYKPDLTPEQIIIESKKIHAACINKSAIIVAAKEVPADATFDFIVRQGAGVNNVLTTLLPVQNCPGENSAVTARNTLNAIAGAEYIQKASQMAYEGKASASNLKPLYGDSPQVDKEALNAAVKGKTVAVLGTGNIGMQTIKGLLETGVSKIRIYGRSVVGKDALVKLALDKRIKVCSSIDEAMTCAHVMVNHMALNVETENLIGKEQLANLANGAQVVDAARAGIIKADDLIEAHKTGKVSKVTVDWDTPEKDKRPNVQKMFEYEGFTWSPHAFADTDPKTRESMLDAALETLEKAWEGNFQNLAKGNIPQGAKNIGKKQPDGIFSLSEYLKDYKTRTLTELAIDQKSTREIV